MFKILSNLKNLKILDKKIQKIFNINFAQLKYSTKAWSIIKLNYINNFYYFYESTFLIELINYLLNLINLKLNLYQFTLLIYLLKFNLIN